MFLKFLILCIYCIAAILLQTTFVENTTLAYFKPDFLAILIVFLSLTYRNLLGLFLCFFFGLVFDFASVVYVGPSAAGAVISFLVVSYVSEKLFIENFLSLIVLGFIVSIVKQAVFALLIISWVSPSFGLVNITETIFTALLTPLIIWILTSCGLATTQKK